MADAEKPYVLDVNHEVLEQCKKAAAPFNVFPYVHLQDMMFGFTVSQAPSWQEGVNWYFLGGENHTKQLADFVYGLCGRKLDGSRFKLFEFAAGYGQMTRHLTKLFPNADIVCCDIHEKAVEFLTRALGHAAFLSRTVPEDLHIEGTFDIAFAMSFFSHMPPTTWGRWVKVLYDALEPGGFLIFTTQGRTHLAGSTLDKIGYSRELPPEGYLYVPMSEQADLSTSDYGAMFVSVEWAIDEIWKHTRAPIAFFREKHWSASQDTYVLSKPR